MVGDGNTKRKETENMVAHYKSNHKAKMEAAGLKVAEWGWLPIDEVIDFLSALKYKHGCTGLRTYFGAHDVEINPGGNPYLGYNTAIFVGTHKKGKVHVDLEILGLDGGGEFDLTIGKNSKDSQSIVALAEEDQDKQHLHPPDDDDNINHVSGDIASNPSSDDVGAQSTKQEGTP